MLAAHGAHPRSARGANAGLGPRLSTSYWWGRCYKTKGTKIEAHKYLTLASSSCMLSRPAQRYLEYSKTLIPTYQIHASGSRAPEAPRRGTKVWGLPKCKMTSDGQHWTKAEVKLDSRKFIRMDCSITSYRLLLLIRVSSKSRQRNSSVLKLSIMLLEEQVRALQWMRIGWLSGNGR